ncbi:MAG: tRNA (adenosine(37)-N6)-threonylcarbamoyltransferase complex transferase subunit TsaD [Caulobacteraceae bacterium]
MTLPLPDPLTVLGIETSCDETAAAVVRLERGRAEVLSSVVLSQVAEHAPFGGVVPEIAARSHVEAIDAVAARALAEAGIGMAELCGIAATAGPGLVGGVMVGLSFAKAIALARGLPLIAVNHLEGHAVSTRLEAEFSYPFLLLLVSGGHCQLLDIAGIGACRRLGSTIDDAAGEAFDKIGVALGLSYPAGPALERLAERGDPARISLPRAMEGREGCDFSFSGLKTAAARRAARIGSEEERADLAAAVQAEIARQLADRTARAMATYAEDHRDEPLRLAVAGGVAANRAVRAALEGLARERGFAFAVPPGRYCTDNAAMIALAGAERLAAGLESPLDAPARPRWPLDEDAARLRPTHRAGRKGAKA